MAFKMKGSPLHRNFGISKSPSKQLVEPDPIQIIDPIESDATNIYIDPLDQLSEEEREEIMRQGESDARLKKKAEYNSEASDKHIESGAHADHHMMFSMGDWIHSPNDKIEMEKEEAAGKGHEHHHISSEESGRLDEIEEQRQTGKPLKMKSPMKQNVQKQQEQYKEEEDPRYRSDTKWWEGKRELRKSKHGWKPAPWAIDETPKGRPTKMKSPLQQGVLTCPECGMQIEDSEGGGEAMMQHITDDHFGGSTGGGTPGYINIHNPGGWEPGDPVGPAATKEDKTPRLNTPN